MIRYKVDFGNGVWSEQQADSTTSWIKTSEGYLDTDPHTTEDRAVGRTIAALHETVKWVYESKIMAADFPGFCAEFSYEKFNSKFSVSVEGEVSIDAMVRGESFKQVFPKEGEEGKLLIRPLVGWAKGVALAVEMEDQIKHEKGRENEIH